MEEFLDAVVAGRPLRDSVPQGLGEVLFAKAVYKSLSSKQWESTYPNNLLDYWKFYNWFILKASNVEWHKLGDGVANCDKNFSINYFL